MRRIVYGLTILTSAFLLFAVQPMVGKALLPRLGGVPGVWTACLLFFQAALVVGYGYVWATARLSPKARVGLHLLLVGVPLLLLSPFGFLEGPSAISATEHPVGFALAFLALNVGLPFTVLSATAPLLSHWYAHESGERPYFLYAASNVGSLGALLAYPFVVEPFLDLPSQALAFRVGFAVVAVGLAVVSAGLLRAKRAGVSAPPQADRDDASGGSAEAAGEGSAEDEAEDRAAGDPAPIDGRRRLTWVGLAFVPTMLLAGASNHVALDLAPVPLLWVVPLALYLLSFILAFSDRLPAPNPVVGRAACLVALVLVFFTVMHQNEPVWLLVLLHLFFLFAGSWIAHRRLADDAPEPAFLPEFFVWTAIGGVSGTLVSGVLAPMVLPDLYEYPVAIALACATRTLEGVVIVDRPWKKDVPHLAALAAIALGFNFGAPYILEGLRALTGLSEELGARFIAVIALFPAAVYAYRWMPLRRRYTLCLLVLVITGTFVQERGARRLSTRSFFGVLRVIDEGDTRHLLHGTTLHGSQRLSERDDCVPMTYYVRESPLGAALEAHRALGRGGRTFAIGLGTGAAACFAAPDESWRFVEINPDVIRIAQDPHWFTYLRNSPSDDVDVVLGDGRVRLSEEPDASLSFLFVDAFNSDSVPVHLITREALRLYVEKLEPGGWAVLHISNRVLDLPRVVGDIAAAEGLAVRLAEDSAATCAILARHPEDLAPLNDDYWRPLAGDPAEAWTDRSSSLLDALKL